MRFLIYGDNVNSFSTPSNHMHGTTHVYYWLLYTLAYCSNQMELKILTLNYSNIELWTYDTTT